MDSRACVDLVGLQALLDHLRGRGWRTIGPTVRDGAIVLADVASTADLPAGVADAQSPGRYRTVRRDDDLIFGWAAPAQSAKPWLLPPDEALWRGRRTEDGAFSVEPIAPLGSGTPGPATTAGPDRSAGPAGSPQPAPESQGIALIGIRGCDLAAIGVHDAVLRDREHSDAHYTARRAALFVVAVTCGTPADTCFCASVGTGPRPGSGADLTLTELTDPHRFLVEAGTDAGAQVLAGIPTLPATDADLEAADDVVAEAIAHMGRQLRTDDLRDLLYASAESPRWGDVASRCLACTNCTAVCPTCFCTSVEDVSDLTGAFDERHRVWDSCFSAEYSRLHGGAVRSWTGSRYRQWLTHKLASWQDQFGMLGCVGCGRCITWCPVGIDLTAEVDRLRQDADHLGAVARPAAASAHPSQAAQEH